eukprot:m.98826 g.98826  ORF g.98826 m.98826 type:complete len:318 (-) comp13650_c1_seq1:117-1070(-)
MLSVVFLMYKLAQCFVALLDVQLLPSLNIQLMIVKTHLYDATWVDQERTTSTQSVMYVAEPENCVDGRNPAGTDTAHCDKAPTTWDNRIGEKAVSNKTLAECGTLCSEDTSCNAFSFTLRNLIETETGEVGSFQELLDVAGQDPEVNTTNVTVTTETEATFHIIMDFNQTECGEEGLDAERSAALESAIVSAFIDSELEFDNVTVIVACESIQDFLGLLVVVELRAGTGEDLTNIIASFSSFVENGKLQVSVGASVTECEFENVEEVIADPRFGHVIDYKGSSCIPEAPEQREFDDVCLACFLERGRRYTSGNNNNN